MVSSGGAPLSRARISTKTGEILILEPDGSVSTMALDSAGGQNAFAVTEADLTALNANLDLNLAGVALPARRVGPTAQELAIEAFAARTQPALPVWREGTEVQPEDFIGTRIAVLNESGAGDLVEVTANLRRGWTPISPLRMPPARWQDGPSRTATAMAAIFGPCRKPATENC